MEDRNEQPAARLKCGMKGMGGSPGNVPRFYADFSKIEWCGIMAATAYKSKTPETVIREAVREYLASRGIIQNQTLAEANARARSRIRVTACNGGILRTFDCLVKRWEFDGLCKVAEHDEKPIGYTTAHAIRYYITMRGIEPPHRDATAGIRTARDVAQPVEAQAQGQAEPETPPESAIGTPPESAEAF